MRPFRGLMPLAVFVALALSAWPAAGGQNAEQNADPAWRQDLRHSRERHDSGTRDSGTRDGSAHRRHTGKSSPPKPSDGPVTINPVVVNSVVRVGGPVTIRGVGGSITRGRWLTEGRTTVLGRHPEDTSRAQQDHRHDGRRHDAHRDAHGRDRDRHGHDRSTHRHARPYYVFVPYFVTGSGVVAGVPVPYPYTAIRERGLVVSPGAVYLPGAPPEGEEQPPARASGVYTFTPSGALTPAPLMPGDPEQGGVSFAITPATATVHVDGVYAGTAADFSPAHAPLTLTAGRHHIDVMAPGHRTMSVDVVIAAGEVIPYEGALDPTR